MKEVVGDEVARVFGELILSQECDGTENERGAYGSERHTTYDLQCCVHALERDTDAKRDLPDILPLLHRTAPLLAGVMLSVSLSLRARPLEQCVRVTFDLRLAGSVPPGVTDEGPTHERGTRLLQQPDVPRTHRALDAGGSGSALPVRGREPRDPGSEKARFPRRQPHGKGSGDRPPRCSRDRVRGHLRI